MHTGITVECTPWGEIGSGERVARYTLRAPNGTEVAVGTLGASLLHWLAPDRHGQCANILLGFDAPGTYLDSSTHMGGLIGRWANRMAGARCVIDGKPLQFEANDGVNLLHGGQRGFDRALWRAEPLSDGVRMHHRSPDGDEGFPGMLDLHVDFRLGIDGTLTLHYEASSTAATPLNLTCHPYFNLAATGSALDHQLRVDADQVLLTDPAGIPTRLGDVDGTAFDFRTGGIVREHLERGDPDIRAAHGIDHCYVVHPSTRIDAPMRRVVDLSEPQSGRLLAVSTTERGMQVYTASNLEGVMGNGGVRHHGYDAICFEAQAWPDQINRTKEEAEAVTLRPGRIYTQTTSYRIGLSDPDDPFTMHEAA